jgi:Holliday junction resolvase hjc
MSDDALKQLRDWFWEGNVQDALVAFLREEGWRVVRTADTAAKDQGPDVCAVMDRRTLVVEVKGYPAGGNKTPPTNQARQWFSHALLAAALIPDRYPGAEPALRSLTS